MVFSLCVEAFNSVVVVTYTGVMEQFLFVTEVRMAVRPAKGADEPTASAPQLYNAFILVLPAFNRKSGEVVTIS